MYNLPTLIPALAINFEGKAQRRFELAMVQGTYEAAVERRDFPAAWRAFESFMLGQKEQSDAELNRLLWHGG